jgi:hypothetical protein
MALVATGGLLVGQHGFDASLEEVGRSLGTSIQLWLGASAGGEQESEDDLEAYARSQYATRIEHCFIDTAAETAWPGEGQSSSSGITHEAAGGPLFLATFLRSLSH